jgi:hypothetical protein
MLGQPSAAHAPTLALLQRLNAELPLAPRDGGPDMTGHPPPPPPDAPPLVSSASKAQTRNASTPST